MKFDVREYSYGTEILHHKEAFAAHTYHNWIVNFYVYIDRGCSEGRDNLTLHKHTFNNSAIDSGTERTQDS